MTQYLQPLFGIFIFICIAWLLSEARSAVRPKIIVAGLMTQFLLGLLLLKSPGSQEVFLSLNAVVHAIQQATEAGTAFVFGFLGGGNTPYDTTQPANSFILAFSALPLLLVISALSSLLYYWRILPLVIKGFSWVLQKTLGISGALGLGAAANIFVGMTEAPLLIRPYLSKLSRSELFALMSCGMATIAGTVMVLYASIIGSIIEGAMGHILVASLLSAPAVLMLAHIIIPEQQSNHSETQYQLEKSASSSMDAITKGTVEGIQLLLNIIAMLIVFVALVHLANQIISLIPALGDEPLTLQKILGWIMAPLVWLTGIPWSEAQAAGALMGVKTILNEFIAYLQLAKMDNSILSQHSKIIMLYSLCGFANLGSLGILIGGLGVMAPERRGEIIELGFKSIITGTLATLMTGTLAGMLL
ncbi:MAG: nucleoside:proton symporter [Gammaproteobacteria bacterium]|nr:nucleoside:proton symporter [Gammaproteobacteria bacterium]